MPVAELGRVMSREEEDAVLGYGPEGYWAMVLDSSAIVAIHLREPGHERLIDRIDAAQVVVVGVPTLLETAMVLTALLEHDARPMLFAFLRRMDAEVVAFHEEHLDAATVAFLRFGRGRHAAALNFGDCMSYAVASVAGLPLLFTGRSSRGRISRRAEGRHCAQYKPPATMMGSISSRSSLNVARPRRLTWD
jgi:ribonuclease VapC